MTNMKQRLTIIAFMALAMSLFQFPAAVAAAGAVTYDAQENVIWVRDYPEGAPATMTQLWQADRQHGWGRILYEGTSETYRVTADIWVGDEKSLGTFLQIGTMEHPREAVVMQGTIWIQPPKKSIPRTDGRMAIVNRLTLGDPANSNIQARLLFDCAKPGQYGLYIGLANKTERRDGGDLWVYNSVISAVYPAWQNIFDCVNVYKDRTQCLHPNEVRFVNASVSWFGGWYGLSRKNSVLSKSVFEHGRVLVGNGDQAASNCVFRDIGIVFREGGCLSARITGCVFAANDCNWTLGSAQSGDIILIDCEVGPQKKPLVLHKNSMTPQQAIQYKRSIYPSCIEQRTLVVKVSDASGRPVPEALVRAECPEHPEGVVVGIALTLADGRTPANPESGAILLTTRRLQATDDPQQPRETLYAYQITARKKGLPPVTLELKAGKAWPKPATLELKK